MFLNTTTYLRHKERLQRTNDVIVRWMMADATVRTAVDATLEPWELMRPDAQKALRDACRLGGDAGVAEAHSLLWRLVSDDRRASLHRARVLELIDYLFQRSVAFRARVIPDLMHVLRHAGGLNGERLPGPKDSVTALRSRLLAVVREWEAKFGPENPRIRVALDLCEASARDLIKAEEKRERQAAAMEQRRQADRRRLFREIEQAMDKRQGPIDAQIGALAKACSSLVPLLNGLYRGR